ncbi:hypothetical protein YC2023_052570 [Brassica napus]
MLSWTNFLKVDMNSVGRYIGSGSFYIVEEENMVVVFGGRKRMFRTCIVGENAKLAEVKYLQGRYGDNVMNLRTKLCCEIFYQFMYKDFKEGYRK